MATTTADHSESSPARAAATVDLQLRGMTCASCVARIDKALTAVAGVASADVNLITQRARVQLSAAATPIEHLVDAVVAAGYEVVQTSRDAADPGARAAAEAGDEAERRQLQRDVTLAAALTAPLLVLAMSHGAIPGSDGPIGLWTQLVLASIVVFGPGRRFLSLALRALRHRTSDMNTLVSLGAMAAWGHSSVVLLSASTSGPVGHGEPHVYFEAAATIVTFVLFGKLLEVRARRHLGDAVRNLHKLVPALARRLGDDGERMVPVAALAVGDQVVVRPGERVPGDGTVVQGTSAIDEAMLTGESLPVDKQLGDAVHGGTLNTHGSLVVQITHAGADTALARIAAAVEAAQGSRAPIARLADRVSAVFVPTVLVLAAITFVVWWLLGPGDDSFATAIERMVAVLVIACPCALGLATPAAVAVGTGRGAELGILWKGGAVLETASRIDTVFVDKTGTLTRGEPVLTALQPAAGFAADAVLAAAAAAERGSEHPLARAVVAAAQQRGLSLPPVRDFRAAVGAGVEAVVDGKHVLVATAARLQAEGIDCVPLAAAAERLAADGATVSFVAIDRRLAGVLALADRPAERAAAVVAELRAAGIEVVMLTGDRAATAAAIGRAVGVTRIEAGLLPADKARFVAAARAQGRRVAMVGDGINDAPALAAADVGIAVSGGTDAAASAADIVLLGGDLTGVPRALGLAAATMRTIRRNLWWASLYNVLGIPVAAGVFASSGLQLSPVLASAAMSLSSVSVLISSLWLRRFARGRVMPGLGASKVMS
jgi:P-type Cu+ transporter